MPACAVVTCKKRSNSTNYNTHRITFHRFPRNPEIKQKWMTATGRGPVWWPDLKESCICSAHFKESDFRPLPKSRRLFDWAVPTLKLPVLPTATTSITATSPKHDSKVRDVDLEVSKKQSDIREPFLTQAPKHFDTKIVSESVLSEKHSVQFGQSHSSTSTVTCDLQDTKLTSPENDTTDLTKKKSDILEPFLTQAPYFDTKIFSGSVLSEKHSVQFVQSHPSTSTVSCEPQDFKLNHNMECVGPDTPRKRKMRAQMESYKSIIQEKNRKIKALQKKTSRYRKRIANLNDVLKELMEIISS